MAAQTFFPAADLVPAADPTLMGMPPAAAGSMLSPYVQQTLGMGIPQGEIDQFLQANPGDYSRLPEAFADDWRGHASDATSKGGQQAAALGLGGAPSAQQSSGIQTQRRSQGLDPLTGLPPRPVPGVPGGSAGGGTPSIPSQAQDPYLPEGFAPEGDAGVYPKDGGVQQVGQDPFSQLLTEALAGLLANGGTPLGTDIDTTLRGLINRGGEVPQTAPMGLEADVLAQLSKILGEGPTVDQPQLDSRFETAREAEHKAFQALMEDARSALGARGLASEPGMPSGSEAGTIQRITERVAPDFASAVRQIYSDLAGQSGARYNQALGTAAGLTSQDTQAQDARLSQAIALAADLSTEQANTILQAAGQGTQRQQVLASIALESLQGNRAWAQFLSEFGLNRDTTKYMLQTGQIQQLSQLLDRFLQATSLSRGGYIGVE